jgi:hypothetical protein
MFCAIDLLAASVPQLPGQSRLARSATAPRRAAGAAMSDRDAAVIIQEIDGGLGLRATP